MANDLSARPWYIDTAAAGVVIFPYQVFIKFIEIVGGTVAPAVGDTLMDIQDRNGKSIVFARAQVAAIREIQTYNVENWYEGLIINAIGPNSVTARIHVK